MMRRPYPLAVISLLIVLVLSLGAVGCVVKIVVTATPTSTPVLIRATATPAPQMRATENLPETRPSEGIQVTFTADRTTLNPGECAVLQWDVKGGFEVLFGRMGEPGEKVSRSGQKQVCPKETTTYWLGVDTGETVEHHLIEITVSSVVPSQPSGPQPPPPTPTPQPLPTPGVVINFRADDTSITAGQCTTLRWDVEHAREVYLDGAGVVGHGSKKVCPGSTTTYTLHVVHAAGTTDKKVTINVTGAPPPPQPKATPTPWTTDVALTELYPKQMTGGEMYVRLANYGPGTMRNVQVEIQCQVTEKPMGSLSGTPKSFNKTLSVDLDPGQIKAFNLGFTIDASKYDYDITCQAVVGFYDPNPANNVVKFVISR